MLAVETPLVRPAVGHDPSAPLPPDDARDARDELARAKARVPAARAKRGDAWNMLVNRPGPMEQRNRRVDVLNRAYHKMHEILLSCALPRVARSVHLCEAPGGFVQAVGDHLTKRGDGDEDWQWVATTLDPDAHPGAPRVDTTALLPTNHGRFLMCDVRDVDECARAVLDETGGAELVTADGAAAMDHDALEAAHLPLLEAQARVIVRVCRPGGSAVIKFFEGLEWPTRRCLAWLAHHFEHCSVIKPTSSRPTNSERYWVCTDRRAAQHDAADDPTAARVSVEWDVSLRTVLTRMASEQTRALRTALATIDQFCETGSVRTGIRRS